MLIRCPFLLMLLVGGAVIRPGDGYSSGAPDAACSGMIPRHGPGAQSTAPPYTLTPLQETIVPGGNATLRLEASDGGVFRGFMVQAVDPSSSKPLALGSFATTANSKDSKILTCSPGFQNTLSHGDAKGKNSLQVHWQAPVDYQGEIEFRASWVKDYETFWVAVPGTRRLRVARQVSATTTTSTTPSYEAPTTYSRNLTSIEATTATPPTAASTTGTPPTTTSTTGTPFVSTGRWNFPTQAAPTNAVRQRAPVYEGCGNVKGCFGLLDGGDCVEGANCEALVTYAVKGARFEFELWAAGVASGSYVAVAVSRDDRMGDDSVTECAVVNGRVGAHVSFNEGKSNARLRDSTSGLKVLETRYSDGNLYCRFERSSPFTVNGLTFDLAERHHLMLAKGPASESAIGYHARAKSVSSRPVQLAELGGVGSSRATLVKLHGAFMVAAWLFAGSCGILLARYFRQTWVGRQFMGKDLWFVLHRVLMMLTWGLTLVAFVVIFVELGGWTSVAAATNPHAVIGLVTTLLAFVQPMMAYVRPQPGTARRPLFNWAHWLVGNAAHILAIVCIFLAVDLDKAAIPYWVNWLLVAYLAVHAFTHTVLSLAQCCFHADGSRKVAAVFAMRDLAPHQSAQNHFYSPQADKKEDAHGSRFRRVLLFFYVLLVGSFAAAVIGVIATGPWAS